MNRFGFIVSGYLLSFSKIKTVKEMIAKSVVRFIRLALPVLFANLIIFLLNVTIGFHNNETIGLFSSSFYQSVFPGNDYTFIDVIVSPVRVLILN